MAIQTPVFIPDDNKSVTKRKNRINQKFRFRLASKEHDREDQRTDKACGRPHDGRFISIDS